MINRIGTAILRHTSHASQSPRRTCTKEATTIPAITMSVSAKPPLSFPFELWAPPNRGNRNATSTVAKTSSRVGSGGSRKVAMRPRRRGGASTSTAALLQDVGDDRTVRRRDHRRVPRRHVDPAVPRPRSGEEADQRRGRGVDVAEGHDLADRPERDHLATTVDV